MLNTYVRVSSNGHVSGLAENKGASKAATLGLFIRRFRKWMTWDCPFINGYNYYSVWFFVLAIYIKKHLVWWQMTSFNSSCSLFNLEAMNHELLLWCGIEMYCWLDFYRSKIMALNAVGGTEFPVNLANFVGQRYLDLSKFAPANILSTHAGH